MILGGTRALCKEGGSTPPADLPARAEALRTAEQLAACWQGLWPAGAAAEKLEAAVLRGVFGSVPGGAGLIPEDVVRRMDAVRGNRYVGTGIQIRRDEKEQVPLIVNPFRSGPAYRAGARPGDLILQVDGQDMRGISLQKAVQLIGGEQDTPVTFVVRQPGARETRTLRMIRGVVPFDTVYGYRRDGKGGWTYRVDPAAPVAYVRVSSLTSSALHELRKAEARMRSEGARAVVLDLRLCHAEGDMHPAELVAGALLDGGVMWRVRDVRGRVKECRAGHECLFRGWPMVVLVHQFMHGTPVHAVAAALQDSGRAVLVGEPTWSDGQVTGQVRLPDGKEVLALPTGRVERTTGRAWLLGPDHVVASTRAEMEALGGWAHQADLPEPPPGAKDAPPADPHLDKAVELLRAALTVTVEPRLRRPAALGLADHGRLLFVAQRGGGAVSVIDTRTLRTTAEVKVGRGIADLAVTPDGGRLLATDEEAHELVVLNRRGSGLDVAHRLKVSPYPVTVQVAPDGARCFVASLWSRALTIIDLAPGAGAKGGQGPRVVKVLDLPFPPRKQLVVKDGAKLIVADSFGGRLAVVDVGRGELESVRVLPAHNIRGLALAPGGDNLLVAHQALNALATATFDDIHWGNLVTNDLRALPLADVLDPKADLLRGSRLYHLGEVGRGAADPSGLAVGAGAQTVLALGGAGEVAVRRGQEDWWRAPVGRRPTAVVVSPDGRRAYVANTLADSVSVVDLVGEKVEAEVGLGPLPRLGAAERGELLFYDARLSHDGWLSCHSCHTDGHANGLLVDNQTDGSLGTPKRVLSLLGVGDTGPWAWNGKMADLESQVRKSVESTMQGARPSAEQVKDLTAFLRSLSPPPPRTAGINPAARLTPAGTADVVAMRRGREVFARHSCASCHASPAYTSSGTYNVGLSDEAGHSLFNPPSLRGVGQGGPYFHDSRAATLEEVFTRERHQLKGELSKGELAGLLAFLRGL
jgi:C-terminal peptidase prc